MAYEVMYEGDGFIRKGPEHEEFAAEEQKTAAKSVQPRKKTWRGGITMFHLMRLLFNH